MNVAAGSGRLPINVTGSNGLSASGAVGSVTINVTGTFSVSGAYHLIGYSGTIQGTGFPAFQLGTTPGGTPTYALANNAGYVDLVVTFPADKWTGIASTEWSTNIIAGSKNWTLLGSPVDFANGDPVFFDDTATNMTVDISVADVTPSSVAFGNTSLNFTLQGSKGLAGTTTLVKEGAGTVTINNTNSFTGAVTINGGTVAVGVVADAGANSPLGAGTNVNLGGGTLSYTGGSAGMNRNLPLSGSSTVAVTNAAATLTLSGVVSGGDGLTKTGNGTLTLTGTNTYTGPTVVNAGRLALTEAAAQRVNSSNTTAAAAVLEVNLAADYDKYATSAVIAGNGTLAKTGAGTWGVGGTTFSMSGGLIDVQQGMLADGWHTTYFTSNMAGLNVAAGATNQINGNDWSVDALTGAGTVQLNYINTRYITVGVNNGSGSFTGVLNEGMGASGYTLSLIKAGTGTQTLAGTNTYTGTTTVRAGTLLVNGSLASSSAVTVQTNATLGGFGAIGGPVTVQNGGTLAPGGAFPATLTINNTLGLAGNVNLRLNKAGITTTSDSVVGVSTLTSAGAVNLSLQTWQRSLDRWGNFQACFCHQLQRHHAHRGRNPRTRSGDELVSGQPAGQWDHRREPCAGSYEFRVGRGQRQARHSAHDRRQARAD